MRKTLRSIRSRPIFSTFVALALIGALFYVFSKKQDAPLVATRVQRGTVTQEVTITGKTRPIRDALLSFERTGKVIRVNAAIGESVTAGQALVQLDVGELTAELFQAEANLAAQAARLAELKKGTRLEDIRVKETELAKEDQDLASEYSSVYEVLGDAYIKAEDAVRKQTADFFTNSDEDPQLLFVVNDSKIEKTAEGSRAAAIRNIKQWRTELDGITGNSAPAALEEALRTGIAHATVIQESLRSALDALVYAVNLSEATATAYKANTTTGRTNVNTSLAAINSQLQAILSQKITVQKIRDELSLKLAGSTPEQIASQDALVKQAAAQVQNARVQIDKMTLRTPIDGIVTKQEAKIGEIAVANTAVAAVISENDLEIEANVPEVDVAKIAAGNDASVTLDAYGPDIVFAARVSSIDPAEAVIDGVATYRTIFQFLEKDARVKPGMTANIEVVTARRENALFVPERSITAEGGVKTVSLLRQNGGIEQKTVTTGLRGSNGFVEITAGLSEGDQVVTYTQKK